MQLDNAFVRQGQIFDAMALPAAGIASYRHATKLNPDYSWSHKHLGDTLAELLSA